MWDFREVGVVFQAVLFLQGGRGEGLGVHKELVFHGLPAP